MGPDWLALVAFGGQVEADDSLVALDAILLLMLSSPGDTLLLVDGATVLVFADELLPGLDAFEAFAGVVSSVVTPVSLVLFEPVPSATGPGGADAFEAFAGVVSSVVTAVSFVLFEPVPSVTGGAPAALLVALPLPVVPD